MRIALVGPTHPYKGGVAQHTTQLAHRLVARGHDVSLVSWYAQLPPRMQRVRPLLDEPEVDPFPLTDRRLSWWRPDTWAKTGSHVGSFVDAVVIVNYTPLQAPAYATIASRARATGATVITICHNVAAHEPKPLDCYLTRALLRRSDEVVVHGTFEAEQATDLRARSVRVVPLPAPHPFAPPAEAPATDRAAKGKVLFFGYVRPYKGLDVLVRALGQTPEHVRLLVAGEVWDDVGWILATAEGARVRHRVDLHPGYVATEHVPALLRTADAMVLPYRSATGSWNAPLAHLHGLPVVATDIEPLRSQVRHGVDGLICQPDDVASLAAALTNLYEPGVLERLRSGIRRPDVDGEWDRYLQVIEESLPWAVV